MPHGSPEKKKKRRSVSRDTIGLSEGGKSSSEEKEEVDEKVNTGQEVETLGERVVGLAVHAALTGLSGDQVSPNEQNE